MPLAEFRNLFPDLCDCLLRTKRAGRIAQAYLLVGDDTELLDRFALAWAQVCTCSSETDDGDACGTCRCCSQLASGDYPERYELRPQSKSRQILIDDVRQFEHQLGLSSVRRLTKIGLIAEADCLGEEAQNAFLKTLEEPNPRTLLMLHTTRPRSLLPTIRSRCQTIALRHNRRQYPLAFDLDLFGVLALLRPNAGAAAALRAANALTAMFDTLHNRAEETTGSEIDPRWQEAAENDTALRKRLEEARQARVEAEYLRLRNELCDALQTWFLQEFLLAAGADRGVLPNPEMFEGLDIDAGRIPAIAAAEQNVRAVEELLGCLRDRVPERLALEVFCLGVTEKKAHRRGAGAR